MGKTKRSTRPAAPMAKPTPPRPVPLPAVAARAPWRTEWEPGERIAMRPWGGITIPPAARVPDVPMYPHTALYRPADAQQTKPPARRGAGAEDTIKGEGTGDG